MQIGSERGGSIGMRLLLLMRYVEISDDEKLRSRYQIPIIVPPGRGSDPVVSRRTNQQLEHQGRAATITAHERDGSSKIATPALSSNRDSFRITMELCRMSGHPTGGGVTIFQCGGEWAFRTPARI